MRRALLLVVALVALVLGWWLLEVGARPEHPRPTPDAAGTTDPTAARSAVREDPAHDADGPVGTRRIDIGDTPQVRGVGALEVTVRRAGDHGPLARVTINLVARDGRDEFTTRRVAVTDDDGTARVDGLDAGPWHVSIDRGATAEVVVVAGVTVECAFDVAAGIDARIRVVDAAGARVPGADVLFWPAHGILDNPTREPGVVVGITDAQGELRVEALTHISGHGAWFAARQASLGVSDLRMVESPQDDGDHAERLVELQLGTLDGAFVDCRVTGGDGAALVGATASMRPLDAPGSMDVGGVRVLRHRSHAERTDELGRVVLGPLPPAQYALRVLAPGHVAHHEFVEIHDATRVARDVTLAPAARLRGVVRTKAGEPVDGAWVVVQIDEEGNDTRSGGDGSFTIDRVPGGTAAWRAEHSRFATAAGEVVLVAGETAALDITLVELPLLHGRVVDEAGAGLAGWTVRARPDLPGYSEIERTMETAADGTFEVRARDDVDWTLTLREPGQGLPPPIPATTGVRPREALWVLQVPDAARATAWIEGFVVDAAGEPAAGEWFFSAGREGPARAWFGRAEEAPGVDVARGQFRIGPLAPGRYTLWIMDASRFEFPIPDIELTPHATTSVGRVMPPATGTLRIAIELGPGVDPGDVMAEVSDGAASDLLKIDVATRQADKRCLPGAYDVTVYGTGFRSRTGRVEVVAGATATFRTQLQPAVRTALRFHMPAGENGATFVVRDARGEFVFDAELEPKEEFAEWWPFLDLGTFDVEATGASGRRYRFRFAVDTLERREGQVDIRVEPAGG